MSPSTPTPDVNDSTRSAGPSGAPEPGTPADVSSTPSSDTADATDATPNPTAESGASRDDAKGDSNDGGIRGDEVEIESVVDPATIRRAPKYKAFFLTGAVVGIVLGLVVWVLWMGSPESGGVLKPGVYLTVVVLGTTTLTTLVAGALAIWADKRSLRR
ncbi:hypothetical protein [Oerskovia turbata]